MSTTFSFSDLSESAQKLAVENVRKTPFYRSFVDGIVDRYYRCVPYEDNFAPISEVYDQILLEDFPKDGGLDITRFHVLAEDGADIDLLLNLIFFEWTDGFDSIVSIEIDGGANIGKTTASVILDQNVPIVADGKEYTKSDVETMFIQWFDASRAEVLEKTKRVFASNMDDASVVKYIEKLNLSFDVNGKLLV